MLTRQGWLVGIGTVALLATGRLLGLPELFVLGRHRRGAADRCRHPRRHRAPASSRSAGRSHPRPRPRRDSRAGSTSPSATCRATHHARARLRDPVSGTRGADLLVPPLGRAERTIAAYRLPDRPARTRADRTARRSWWAIRSGSRRLGTVAAPKVALTVYPHVDQIDPLPYTTGHDPLAGARQPNSLGRTGEDFYALRPYVVGDDLRRIHWPTSARHDELLVRQNELPWQGRTTVLLDVRKAAAPGESLEVAVSAAASIVSAHRAPQRPRAPRHHRRHRLRLRAGLRSHRGDHGAPGDRAGRARRQPAALRRDARAPRPPAGRWC